MPEKEVWELELKNASLSYKAMPIWMRRIEEKTRKNASKIIEQPINKTQAKKSVKKGNSK